MNRVDTFGPRHKWPRRVSGCGGLWSFVPPGLFRKLPRHVMVEKHVRIFVTGNAVASGLLPYRRIVPGVLQVVFCSLTGRRNHPCHEDQHVDWKPGGNQRRGKSPI
jgi:hypothetical protein